MVLLIWLAIIDGGNFIYTSGCSGEDLIDLTQYRGRRFVVHDFNGYRGTFVDNKLECVRAPHQEKIDHVGGGPIRERYFDREFFLKDIVRRDELVDTFREHYVYRHLNPKNLEIGLSYEDDNFPYPTTESAVSLYYDPETGEEGYEIADKAGRWTLNNKAEYSLFLECLPSAPDYDSCYEIEYIDHYGDTHRVSKGKVLKEIVNVSQDIIIRDYDRGGAGDATVISEEVSTPEASVSEELQFLAPNTGFFDEGDDNDLTSFLSLISLITLIGINRRFF